MDRGMNAAIAVHGDYAYVGSRTDGGHEGMPHGGVMVIDVSNPSDPTLLGPPFDAKPGESSRELRVWKSQDILVVLNTNCGVGDTLHHCTQPSISNFRFYDIAGANASDPQLLNQFNVNTHEFFLWEDPERPGTGTHVRGQRRVVMRDERWLAQLPVLGTGHLPPCTTVRHP
jgi:LVIVD repeat-containing protein